RAGDGGDEHDGCVRLRTPDGVEKAVHGGAEGAHAEAVAVDDVDSELESDQVGRMRGDRLRDRLVEHGLPSEAEVAEVQVEIARDALRPRTEGAWRFQRVADRTAVVQPPRPRI